MVHHYFFAKEVYVITDDKPLIGIVKRISQHSPNDYNAICCESTNMVCTSYTNLALSFT